MEYAHATRLLDTMFGGANGNDFHLDDDITQNIPLELQPAGYSLGLTVDGLLMGYLTADLGAAAGQLSWCWSYGQSVNEARHKPNVPRSCLNWSTMLRHLGPCRAPPNLAMQGNLPTALAIPRSQELAKSSVLGECVAACALPYLFPPALSHDLPSMVLGLALMQRSKAVLPTSGRLL